MLLRFAGAFSLLSGCMTREHWGVVALLFRSAEFAVAVMLLLGFATPLAAVGEAVIQISIMILGKGYDSPSIVSAALGLALAMLGPGAWSLDARVFGRKRIV